MTWAECWRLLCVPVHAILEDVISLVSNDPAFENVELNLAGPQVAISCDIEMFKPVVLNLLVNGAQAMAGKGRLDIAVETETDCCEESCCRITIRDEGPGIPEEAREKIFEPFFTTKGGGTGLGLPIARKVVELHGGTISISCPEAGGTEVTVRLPREGRDRAAPPI